MTDDRIACTDCARYVVAEFLCTAAHTPMQRVPDVLHRCEYFNAKPGAADMRKGIERWPELRDYPGGPARKPYPERAA